MKELLTCDIFGVPNSLNNAPDRISSKTSASVKPAGHLHEDPKERLKAYAKSLLLREILAYVDPTSSMHESDEDDVGFPVRNPDELYIVAVEGHPIEVSADERHNLDLVKQYAMDCDGWFWRNPKKKHCIDFIPMAAYVDYVEGQRRWAENATRSILLFGHRYAYTGPAMSRKYVDPLIAHGENPWLESLPENSMKVPASDVKVVHIPLEVNLQTNLNGDQFSEEAQMTTLGAVLRHENSKALRHDRSLAGLVGPSDFLTQTKDALLDKLRIERVAFEANAALFPNIDKDHEWRKLCEEKMATLGISPEFINSDFPQVEVAVPRPYVDVFTNPFKAESFDHTYLNVLFALWRAVCTPGNPVAVSTSGMQSHERGALGLVADISKCVTTSLESFQVNVDCEIPGVEKNRLLTSVNKRISEVLKYHGMSWSAEHGIVSVGDGDTAMNEQYNPFPREHENCAVVNLLNALVKACDMPDQEVLVRGTVGDVETARVVSAHRQLRLRFGNQLQFVRATYTPENSNGVYVRITTTPTNIAKFRGDVRFFRDALVKSYKVL